MNSSIAYLLPFFYFICLSFLLAKQAGLAFGHHAKKFTVALFAAKCGAGLVYNWVALHYIPNRGDVWPFYEDGLQMYHQFWQQPWLFFKTYFSNFGQQDTNIFDTNSAVALGAFELIKAVHFLFNFLSFGNMATNTILFNFLAVLCSFQFLNFLKNQLGKAGLRAGLLFFLLPSMFFYTAAIHKEGIVVILLCLISPFSYKLLSQKLAPRLLLQWLVIIAFLFAFKFFVAIIWVACMAVWWLLLKFPGRQWRVFACCVIAGVCFFGAGKYISPSLHFPKHIAERQAQFLALPAASAMPVKIITQAPYSYLVALPLAVNNSMFEPLPGQGGKRIYLLFSVEIILFWVAMFYFFMKRKEPLTTTAATLLKVLLLFGFLNLLLIGFTVPNVGAMLRYRSIFLPFIAVFIFAYSWRRSHKK